MNYKIIQTTDGKYIGTVISIPARGDIIMMGDFEFEVAMLKITGKQLTLSNSNYIIVLTED